MKLALTPRHTGLLAVLVVAVLVAGVVLRYRAANPPPPPPKAVTLAYVVSPFAMPVVAAKAQGYFRDAGLEVTFKPLPTGRASLEALLRGEIDVATAAETPIVFNSFDRHDFVVLANMSESSADEKLVAHPESGIRTHADLRGKRIGVPTGTSAHYFLHALLADHGMIPADIVEVPLQPGQLVEAMLARRVDAIAAFEPAPTLAAAALPPEPTVFDCRNRCRTTLSLVAVRGFAQARPEIAQGLLQALSRGIDWMRAHPDAAIDLAVREFKVDAKGMAAHWRDYNFELTLDQAHLISLENVARWSQAAFPVAGRRAPNYLEYLETAPLRVVRPGAVTLIE